MSTETTQQKKGGCGKYLGIGCLSILVLAVIGAFIAYFLVKGFMSGLVDKYTVTQPITLTSIQFGEREAADVLARMAAFTNALQDGRSPAELDLTSRDINVLIHSHPGWTNLAGKVYVTIAGDEIRGDVCVPLNEVGGMLKGRWLVGSAGFQVGITAGRLALFMNSLTVNGKSPPEAFMKEFRAKNLVEGVNGQPEMAALLGKLDSVSVRDGMLRIIPRQAR